MIIFFVIICITKSQIFNISVDENIICENKADAQLLLYKICSYESICSELYQIPRYIRSYLINYPNSDPSIDLNMKKEGFEIHFENFIYTTKDIGIIQSLSDVASQINNENLNDIYNFIWIKSWQNSTKNIIYSDNINDDINNPLIKIYHCSTLDMINFYPGEVKSTKMLYIYSIIYSLMIYKEYFTMGDECNDPNEKRIIDMLTGEGRCLCVEGKICGQDNQFHNIIVTIVVFLILMIVIKFIVDIYSTVGLYQKIDRIPRTDTIKQNSNNNNNGKKNVYQQGG